MSIYIKSMEMPTGDNTKIIAILSSGEVFSVYFDNESGNLGLCQMSKTPVIAVPIPPHGRVIDADEFLNRAIGTRCFSEDYALMLDELVGESYTIIPAEEGEG